MSELSKRILVAAVGIPAAMGAIYAGDYIFSLTILFLAYLGIGEYIDMIKAKGVKVQTVTAYLSTIAVISAFALFFEPDKIAFLLIVILFATALGIYLSQIFRGVVGAIATISSTINVIIYVSLGFSSLIIIRNFHLYLLHWRNVFSGNSFLYGEVFAESFTWALFLFFIFATIWICDSAAYFVGKAYGKNKLHPEVSPKKSWEGAIAGFISAVVAFTLLNFFFIPQIPILFSIVGGVLTGVFGQLGDLAESQLKRDSGIKDSSSLLPGHGGILDRFDSALFVFPVMLLYLFVINSF